MNKIVCVNDHPLSFLFKLKYKTKSISICWERSRDTCSTNPPCRPEVPILRREAVRSFPELPAKAFCSTSRWLQLITFNIVDFFTLFLDIVYIIKYFIYFRFVYFIYNSWDKDIILLGNAVWRQNHWHDIVDQLVFQDPIVHCCGSQRRRGVYLCTSQTHSVDIES